MMIWLQSTLLITRKLKGLQGVLQMILMMKCPWMLSVFQWSLLVLHFLPGQNCPLGRRCHHILSQVRPTSVGDSPACSTLCVLLHVWNGNFLPRFGSWWLGHVVSICGFRVFRWSEMGISILFTFLDLAGCNSVPQKRSQRPHTVLKDKTVPVSITSYIKLWNTSWSKRVGQIRCAVVMQFGILRQFSQVCFIKIVALVRGTSNL